MDLDILSALDELADHGMAPLPPSLLEATLKANASDWWGPRLGKSTSGLEELDLLDLQPVLDRLVAELDTFNDAALEKTIKAYPGQNQTEAKIRITCKRELAKRGKSRADAAAELRRRELQESFDLNPTYGMF